MLTVTQFNSEIVKSFEEVQPGMELQCKYRLQDKRNSSQGTKDIVFKGPVIQKTKHLFAVRDRNSKHVHCLSINDCICGYGKYKVINI